MRKTAAVLGLSALCGSGVVAQAPTPATMNEAPHFERLTYLRHMRVFELTLAPGEATVDHRHDHDVATVSIGESMTRSRVVGQDWGAATTRASGAAQTAIYTGMPAVHRTENVGPGPLRLFVIENLRDSGWSTPPPLTAPGTTLQHESKSFAVHDIRLTVAVPTTTHVHQNPSFILLVSGAVQVQGGGGESEFRLEQPGRWFPTSGPDQPHSLTRVGAGDAHVVCVEAR
jgi:quercetin dioxygenase-like cupin family protein